VKPVDQKAHRDQQEKGDHRVDAHDVAVLGKRQAEVVPGEQQIEHGAADGRGVVAGHCEEEPAVEAQTEALPEIGPDRIPFGRLRRRVLSLLDQQAHQHEGGEVDQCDGGEDPRHVEVGVFDDVAVESEAGDGADHPEQRHEAAHELFGHHVREDVVEDREYEHVEALERDRENNDAADDHRRRRNRAAEHGLLDEAADRVAPAEQDQEQRHEGAGEQ
jgi:hypothetical protein